MRYLHRLRIERIVIKSLKKDRMKSIFISYNMALTEPIMRIIDVHGSRGFTQIDNTFGRGSKKGEPHYGSHTWPSINSTIITMVEDNKVEPMLTALRELDSRTEEQGLRAFVWDITNQL